MKQIFFKRVSERYECANVIAFEADPRVYEHFQASLAATKVDYRFAAVADKSGDTLMHIPEVVAGNEIPYRNRMASLNVMAIENSKCTSVTVPAMTLNDVVSDISYGNTVLWIDRFVRTEHVIP